VFEIELNSATDNPLVFENAILSGGNFHGAPLALALDYLAIALCQLAGISERRTERMLNPALRGASRIPGHTSGVGIRLDDGAGDRRCPGC
jgi:histidine ammonia-lyase